MTTETMTVHKALCELKTLDNRIGSAINDMAFVFANKHSNNKVGGVEIEKVCEEIKKQYQSAQDLIARRRAIKSAVVLSNATTKIRVCDMECTVAEAIDMKNNWVLDMGRLLRRLSDDSTRAKHTADLNNGDALELRADAHIKAMFGASDMKGASAEVIKSRSDFIEAQTTEVVDPLDSQKEMEKLNKLITDFGVEVDSALSVSNALTTIEVSY